MERAYSPSEILKKKIPSIPFEGVWRDASESLDVQVSGSSGERVPMGRAPLRCKLARELTKYGKVAYNSLEESLSLSFQNNMRRCRMEEARGRFLVLDRDVR